MKTRRKDYALRLARINQLSPESGYWRRMSFTEIDQWLLAYRSERRAGWPKDMAVQRAWDCYFAVRTKGLHR